MKYHLSKDNFIECIEYPNYIFKFTEPRELNDELIQWVYKNDEYFGMFNASKNILVIYGIPFQMHGKTIEIRHFLKTFAGNKND